MERETVIQLPEKKQKKSLFCFFTNIFRSKKVSTPDGKPCACYILIHCSTPNEKDGSMEVEMTYEGDKFLASYLIKNAQELLDEQLNNS